MLATIVKVNQKAPFSIATTMRCGREHYSFPWIAPLYHWYILYIAELSKEVSSTIFIVFGMTQPRIEPRSPRPLVNTLPTRPMSRLIYDVTMLAIIISNINWIRHECMYLNVMSSLSSPQINNRPSHFDLEERKWRKGTCYILERKRKQIQ